jgi:hypothetical protein
MKKQFQKLSDVQLEEIESLMSRRVGDEMPDSLKFVVDQLCKLREAKLQHSLYQYHTGDNFPYPLWVVVGPVTDEIRITVESIQQIDPEIPDPYHDVRSGRVSGLKILHLW